MNRAQEELGVLAKRREVGEGLGTKALKLLPRNLGSFPRDGGFLEDSRR